MTDSIVMKRNILLSYILTYLFHSYFWLGTWVFYYLRFTDYAGIGIIEMIMILLTMGLEIPTGVLADTIGKRNTLKIAFLLSGIGNLIFGFSTSFHWLIVSVFVTCVGWACYSGTLEALQYDSLKDMKKEKLFAKISSNSNTLMLIAFAISSIIGGFLYKFMPGLPFIMVGIFLLIGFVVVFFLKEPKHDTEKFALNTALKQQLQGFIELSKSPQIIRETFLLVGTGIFLVIASQVLNDVLGVEFGFQPQQFGIISASMYLIASAATQLVPILRKKLSSVSIVLITALGIAGTFIVSPFLGFMTGAFILGLRWCLQYMYDSTASIIVNTNAVSKYRATTISTLNMLKNLPYALAAYSLGSVMEHASARMFAYYLGIAMLGVIAVAYTFLQSNKKFSH